MFLVLFIGGVQCWLFSLSDTAGFVTSDATSVDAALDAVDLYGLSNGGCTAFAQTVSGSQVLYHALNNSFETIPQPDTIIALNSARGLAVIQLLNGAFYFSTSYTNISLPVDSIQEGVLLSTSSGYYTLVENNSVLYVLEIFPNSGLQLYPTDTFTLALYEGSKGVQTLTWSGTLFVLSNTSLLSANALIVLGNFLENEVTVETDTDILLPEHAALSNSSWLILRLLPGVFGNSQTSASFVNVLSFPVSSQLSPSGSKTLANTVIPAFYITTEYQLVGGTTYTGTVIIGSTSSLSLTWDANFIPLQFSQLNITGGTLTVNLNDVKYGDGSTIELFNFASGEGEFTQILVVGAATTSCVQTKAIPEYQNNKVYLHLEIATSCLSASGSCSRFFI
jgi:hypothetical protein